jgi:hypothetical protein
LGDNFLRGKRILSNEAHVILGGLCCSARTVKNQVGIDIEKVYLFNATIISGLNFKFNRKFEIFHGIPQRINGCSGNYRDFSVQK